MADEFIVPNFLKGQSTKEIHRDMVEQIPDDIDMSEGGHPYNYTYPTAYQMAMFTQFRLTEAIKLIFPKFSEHYPDILAYHGNTRGIQRNAAIPATGELLITAEIGTKLPYKCQFSTMSINGLPAVLFETLEEIEFDEETKTVKIQAKEAGTSGNVKANTITLCTSNITGIKSITNPLPTSEGYDEEDIIHYQNRI